MERCCVCGKNIFKPIYFGNQCFCRNCLSLIDTNSWTNNDYITLENLKSIKNDIVYSAGMNKFPLNVIFGLEDYFDSLINEGFISTFNGKSGQKITIFSDYFIIETDERKIYNLTCIIEDFFPEDDEDYIEEDESIISRNKDNIVKGLVSGKFVSTGVGLVASAVIDSNEKEKRAEKRAIEKKQRLEQLFISGKHRFNLSEYSSIDLHIQKGAHNGYIRFVKKDASPHNYYCTKPLTR